MRKLILAALLIVFPLGSQDILVNNALLTSTVTSIGTIPDPLFELNFDADSGDYTGTDGSGACTPASMAYTDTGGGNFAGDLNGTNSIESCGQGLDDGVTNPSFTIFGWFNHDTFGESSVGRIIAKSASAGGDWQVTLNDTSDFDRIQMIIASASAGSNNYNAPDDSVLLDGWYSYGVVVSNCADLSTCAVQIYVNGSAVTTSKVGTATGARASNPTNAVVIGNFADTSRTFDGLIDYHRVWSEALTAEQIAVLHAEGRL